MNASQTRRWSNVTRSGKLHYNSDQLALAKQASALEYARSKGYDLVGKGNRWHIRGHDSMVFRADGRWYWNSRGCSGRAIEFIMYYEGRTLPEAVLILNGVDLAEPDAAFADQTALYAPKTEDLNIPAGEFQMPARAKEMSRTVHYLCEIRGIDGPLVWELVRQGRIFETVSCGANAAEYHNAAFAGLDGTGRIRSVMLRGCGPASTFKGEVPGSDKSYPFEITGRPGAKKLYIFESAIDAMSHATIQKLVGADWENDVRIAMSGNNTIAPILRVLEHSPALEELTFCLDADEAGAAQGRAYRKALIGAGFKEDRIHFLSVPYGKDWNEYLKRWRMVVAQSNRFPTTGVEVPGQRECCGRIHYLNQNGEVESTVAYQNPARFAAVMRTLEEQHAGFVAETPEQLQQLRRNRQRRRDAEKERTE